MKKIWKKCASLIDRDTKDDIKGFILILFGAFWIPILLGLFCISLVTGVVVTGTIIKFLASLVDWQTLIFL